MVEILSAEAGGDTEGGVAGEVPQGTFATDEAGEKGGVVGTSDCAFVCWLTTALGSPSDGLLRTCGADKDEISGVLVRLIASCLRACMAVPISLKVGMLRALAIIARGLELSRTTLGGESARCIRSLREAAIAQHTVEVPLVGSQRAQFSAYLQALVEAVAVLDTGPVKDFALMSHSELLRAIEAVDGPPGAGLSRAALSGSEEQLSWCLSRGARPEAACPERLVQSSPSPHFALHYAAHGGHVRIIAMLFERRADLHCVDGDGNRPLAWAAAKGNLKAVEELLRLGSDPRHRNNKGKTALMLATVAGGSQIEGGWTGVPRRTGDHRGVVSLLDGLEPDAQVLSPSSPGPIIDDYTNRSKIAGWVAALISRFPQVLRLPADFSISAGSEASWAGVRVPERALPAVAGWARHAARRAPASSAAHTADDGVEVKSASTCASHVHGHTCQGTRRLTSHGGRDVVEAWP